MALVDVVKSLLPSGLGKLARDLVGVTALQAKIDRLETVLYETKDEARQRSQRRWRETAPTIDLTWGIEVTGDAFIAKAASYKAFGPDIAVLEIGPGYGRLPKAILAQQSPFKRYLGVDISSKNVAYLRKEFPDPRLQFVQGDIEEYKVEGPFDLVISSLVLKHLFPSFEAALRNIAPAVTATGLFIFDLVEGERTFFETDDVTYVRQYTQQEVAEILERTGLLLVAFDKVWHDARQVRLLVVARKAAT